MVQHGYRCAACQDRASHVVLLINLTRTNIATGSMSRSKLTLADLAGMNDWRASSDVAAAYKALETVLQALARGEKRIPFRDHVLTQVLQDCLGGEAKTVM